MVDHRPDFCLSAVRCSGTGYQARSAWRNLARAHDALYRQTRDLEGREESPSYAIIDSQSAKTGPDARDQVEFDAGKKIKGRKRHILVDTLGLILKAEVHSAGIQDRDGAALVFDKLTNRFPFIETICGDGGYLRPKVRDASPRPVEIVKRNHPGFEVLPKRWIVERTFAWLGLRACRWFVDSHLSATMVLSGLMIPAHARGFHAQAPSD